MNQPSKRNMLFSEFSKSTKTEWIRLIESDLKLPSLDSVTRKTFEGFSVPPVFTSGDLDALEFLDTEPGKYPYVRGIHSFKNQWLIRQDFLVEDPDDCNKHVKNAIEKGTQEIGYVFRSSKQVTASNLELLLKDIPADTMSFSLNSECSEIKNNIRELLKFLEKNHIDPAQIRGGFEFDPLYQNLNSEHPVSSDELQASVMQLLQTHMKEFPGYRMLLINGHGFSDLTTSIIHELAFSLAEGTEYLSWIFPESVSSLPENFIGFKMGIGPNFFMEIAKIRALRLLWSRIISAFNDRSSKNSKVFVWSRSSSWNKTIYDPHVNILRYTAEVLSAALGGANSISIYPFDTPQKKESQLAERIARNAQIIFREESYLEQICDPAGGSYYIENLTHMIARETWRIFQEIEHAGGFTAYVKSGLASEAISNLQSQRDSEIHTRKTILVGTNHYPNLDETYARLQATDIRIQNAATAHERLESMNKYRGAKRFEILRKKTEEQSGRRSTAILFPFGHPAKRSARVTFASNFIGCGGFLLHDLTGIPSISEGIEFCLKEDPDIIVFCSSDEEYPECLPGILRKLGGDHVYIVAGYPKDHLKLLQKLGIQFFIHHKSDVFHTLQTIQETIGID